MTTRALSIALAACAVFATADSAQETRTVDFARDVQPIFKQSCIGCHGPAIHQNGFRLDRRSDAMRADTVSYILLGLAAEKFPADAATDAMAFFLKRTQLPNGRWRILAHRPPLESSDIEVTAASMRALQLYAPKGRGEYQQAVRRAAAWIAGAPLSTTEDRAFQLLGLGWSGAAASAIRTAGLALIGEQRPDGGWAQLPTMTTDAYATGQALVALVDSGVIKARDPVYARGVRFLLNSQFEDGSWFVKTRAIPLQPLFDIGFPHGADSWISAAGTNWATLALVRADAGGPTGTGVR